jgi:ribosome-binding factor A
MLPYKRSQRVSHLLKKEISEIISRRVKDPRLGFLTLTDIDISPDLKNAKVYVSIFREDEREPTMEALKASASFIRSELGRRVKMKNIPLLTFMMDLTPEYGEKMERIFKDLKEKEGGISQEPENNGNSDSDER